MIRKAEPKDISRIAEILVFTKRMKYRSIFHNDEYSFNGLQVVKVAGEFKDPKLLGKVWVYDDGIVKGMIHLEGKEIAELYVDYFFWKEGIGILHSGVSFMLFLLPKLLISPKTTKISNL